MAADTTAHLPLNPPPTAQSARAWATEAALAATRVPAVGRERTAWTIRSWAEVAVGCLILGGAASFSGLDEVIRVSGVRSGGRYAARLRELRALAGPVPAGYPARLEGR